MATLTIIYEVELLSTNCSPPPPGYEAEARCSVSDKSELLANLEQRISENQEDEDVSKRGSRSKKLM